MEPVSTELRWSRAWKHAGLAALAVFALGMMLIVAGVFKDPGAGGEAVGKIMMWVGLFTLFASYGRQTGRRPLFYLGILLVAVVLLGPIPLFLWAAKKEGASRQLTAPEIAALTRSGGKLCQPALGVSLADPGEDFEVDEATARKLNEGVKVEGFHSWVFTRRDLRQRLLVQVIKGTGGTGESFAGFASSLRKGAVKPGQAVDAEQVDARAKPYQYRLALTHDGSATDVYCVAARQEEPFPMILCTQSGALDHEALRTVRESVTFGSCR